MGVDSTKGSTPPPRDSGPARGSLVYAVGIAIALIGVLAVALYGISSERTPPDPARVPQPDAARARDERPAVTPVLPPHDLSTELHARLGTVGEQLDALVAQSASMRKRVETLERELARRPAAGAAAAPAPAPAPAPPARAVPADLEPLYARLSTIETSLEREGVDRLKAQEDLLARVYKLEASRGDGDAARLSAQKAAEERVYKLEQRLHDAETQLVEAERRLAARIEKLESR